MAGIGVSGFAAADGLLEFGARVTVLDDRADSANSRQGHRCWRPSAPPYASGPGSTAELPADADLVITTGWPADRPAAGPGRRAVACRSGARSSWPGGSAGRPRSVPWLGITGTNGKTTTTQMLESILSRGRAAHGRGRQHRPADHGDRARPASRTTCSRSSCPATSCTGRTPWPCTRPRCSTSSPTTWSGTARYAAYRAAKATIYTRRRRPAASTTWPTRPPSGWSRRPRWSRAPGPSASPSARPGLSMLGVVDDLLVDRAFIEQRRDSALELAKISDVPGPAGARTTSRTPWPPPRWPGRSGCRPPRSAMGCARSPLGAHKIQTGRRAATGCAGSTTPRPPTRTRPTRRCGRSSPRSERAEDRLDRRRPGQGHHFDDLVSAHAGPAARRGAARRRPRGDRRSAGPTRAGCPGQIGSPPPTLEPWRRPSRRPSRWPDPAMPCCWPRVAPARTCTPTTPRAGTPSPRPSAELGEGGRPDR